MGEDLSEREAYRELIEGTLTGDLVRMQRGLEKGADLAKRDGDGLPVLSHAIRSGQREAFEWLLSKGADVNARVQASLPLVTWALRNGDEAFVLRLVEAGADLQGQGLNDHFLPARAAIEHGGRKTLEEMARRGVRFSDAFGGNEDPLRIAVLSNNHEAVKYLLDAGASVNELMANENYPLADAALIGDVELLRLLLDRGADVNAISNGLPPISNARAVPHTALINAVRRNHLTSVQLLLKAGADPKALNNEAILWADLQGNREIYSALVQAGASEPTPYDFLNLPALTRNPDRGAKETPAPLDFHGLIKSPTQKEPATLEKPLTLAVLAISEGLEPVVDVLSAELSQVPNLSLLERQSLPALAAERLRGRDGRLDPVTLAGSGALEGADFVLFLTGTPEATEIRLIEASTGIVFCHAFASKVLDGTDRARPVVMDLTHALRKSSPGNRLLVSIPRFTSTRSTPETDRLERQLSTGLSVLLNAHPKIVLLDREKLRTLSLEKDLRSDAATFVKSGLLVDGGMDLTSDGQLTITLRARSVEGQEKAVAEVRGASSDSIKLLQEVTRKVLDQLDSQSASAVDSNAEASAYLNEARVAYGSRLWAQAHANALAAESFGLANDDLLRLRLLSIVMLMRSDLLKTEDKRKATRDDEELEILAYAMPLRFRDPGAPRRNPQDYIDLALDLLDVITPVIASDVKPEGRAKEVWEYLPHVFAAATLPLEMLTTISDQKAYETGLDELRSKLIELSSAAIQKTRQPEWVLPRTCKALIFQRAKFLPLWKTSESEAIAEVLELFAQDHRFEYPYESNQLGTLVDHLSTPLGRFGTRLATYPIRLAEALGQSEVPEAKLRGASLMARWCFGSRHEKAWTVKVRKAFEELYLSDRSRGAMAFLSEPTTMPPTLARHNPDGPNFRPSVRPWYRDRLVWAYNEKFEWSLPRSWEKGQASRSDTFLDPQFMDWAFELTRKRLDFIANEGGVFFFYPMDLALLSSEKRALLAQDANRAHQSIVNRVRARELAQGVDQQFFSEALAGLAKIDQAEVNVGTPLGSFVAYSLDDIPDFRGKPVVKKDYPHQIFIEYDTFNFGSDQSGDESAWVRVQDVGFLEFFVATGPGRAVPFPENCAGGEIVAVSDRYLVAEFREPGKTYDGVALYDFKKRSWRSLGPRYRSSGSLMGDVLFLTSVAHPDGGEAAMSRLDDRCTLTLDMINLKDFSVTPLVSSRRTPPQSPLDNQSQLDKMLGAAVPMSEKRFFYAQFVHDLSTGTWEPASKEDRATVSKIKNVSSPSSLHPWFGTVFAMDLDEDRGALMLPFRVDVARVDAMGKETTSFDLFHIEMPKLAFVDKNQKPLDFRKFHFMEGRIGMFAFDTSRLALIPASSYVPLIKDWLEKQGVARPTPKKKKEPPNQVSPAKKETPSAANKPSGE